MGRQALPRSLDDQIAELRERLGRAAERVDAFDREIKAIERKRDAAETVAGNIQAQLGEALIQSWGATPDWSVILQESCEGGMTVYRAGTDYLEGLGLSRGGGIWSDNREPIIAFGFSRGSTKHVYKVDASIRYLAPFMRKRRGGVVWFNVFHREPESCCWTLHYRTKTGTAKLEQQVRERAVAEHEFPTLLDALVHVQQHLWCEDEIDHTDLVITQDTPEGPQLLLC